MRKVIFNVACFANYESSLSIPDELVDRRDILNYIRDHLKDAPVGNLKHECDLKPEAAVEFDDIIEII